MVVRYSFQFLSQGKRGNGETFDGGFIIFTEIRMMEAQALETEFSFYWEMLTIVQKEAILEVVKNFVKVNEGMPKEITTTNAATDVVR